MQVQRRNFYDLEREQLHALLAEQYGATKFRSVQLFEWVYGKQVTDFDQMSDISRDLRAELAALFTFPKAKIHSRLISSDGTRKYLLEVNPGRLVESVMIKQPKRMTLCVSSQIGCGMGCSFCRTGDMGLKSNLLTSEIVSQVLAVIEDAKNFDDMFNNIVFMGMGEPLHNFNNVTNALRILTDRHGLRIAPRKITVSTVGLVPAIKKFAALGLDVNLAVSLNATTDEVRSKIMPINKAFKIEELLNCLVELPRTKRKRYTIEYVMLNGVNDSDQDKTRLVKLLRRVPAKLNLIPYNENAGLGFRSPQREKVIKWQNDLTSYGIDTTIRWSKGSDIKAACGQLALESQVLTAALQ